MWFSRGTRFLLTRGEYGEISTGIWPVLLTRAVCAPGVGSTDVPFHASALSGQTRRLACRGVSADPCKRQSFVTRELSILRGALARGPPDHHLTSLFSKMDLRNTTPTRRNR
jgi:hypothetical protein